MKDVSVYRRASFLGEMIETRGSDNILLNNDENSYWRLRT